MNSAVIVAGGSSIRFGGKIPKQFIQLGGREILSYPVNTFLNHPQIDEVIIVCHHDYLSHVISHYPDCIVIEGGKQRRDSSLKGVRATDDGSENVLIHDAARPLVSKEIINSCLTALENACGSAPVIKVSNSLLKLDNGKASYLDRSLFREIQTPQCFKKKVYTKNPFIESRWNR